MFKFRPDVKKMEIAILLIILGISLRALLAPWGNIEPILAVSMLAGLILGGIYAFFVPLIMMVLSDWVMLQLGYGGVLGWSTIFGISFFTWSGMVFAGIIGTRMKPIFLFNMKSVAVFTGVGILTVLVFDAWTLIGVLIFFPGGLEEALAGQIPWTIRHLFSTLIFVPLLTTLYIYIHEYGVPSMFPWWKKAEIPDNDKNE